MPIINSPIKCFLSSLPRILSMAKSLQPDWPRSVHCSRLAEHKSENKVHPDRPLTCNWRLSPFSLPHSLPLSFPPFPPGMLSGEQPEDPASWTMRTRLREAPWKITCLYGGFGFTNSECWWSFLGNSWNAVPPQFLGEPPSRDSLFLLGYHAVFYNKFVLGSLSFPT